MNSLNSILIEGTLTSDAMFKEIKGSTVCVMELESYRYLRKGEGTLTKFVNIEVHAVGKLAEVCVEMGHSGRKIRVVGRLDQIWLFDHTGEAWKVIFIAAEHVEFKPV